MSFRLYKLDTGPSNPKVVMGSGKVFGPTLSVPRKKQQEQQITGSGITSTINKPISKLDNKVNPNIEDLQHKLSSLVSYKTTRNGKPIKRFVAL